MMENKPGKKEPTNQQTMNQINKKDFLNYRDLNFPLGQGVRVVNTRTV